MGLFDIFGGKKEAVASVDEIAPTSEQPVIIPKESGGSVVGGMGGGFYGGGNVPIIQRYWNGEKTPGELGAVIVNIPEYNKLRLRALDAYAKTDIIKTISSKFFQWVVGSGLKLEAEPNDTVLRLENIEFDKKSFKEGVEARFSVYANTVYADYERRRNLHDIALDAFKESFFGDALVVCRIENEGVNVQIISGSHVETPLLNTDAINEKEEGNYIEHGIEFNERGEHVAYYVCAKDKENWAGIGTYERIPAYGKNSKRRLAWMIYGQKLSPDHKRGVPQIAQILEKVNKLDRYTEASVSKAEQAANILFTITHQEFSTGENPIGDVLNRKMGGTAGQVVDSFKIGDGLANKIHQSTSNTTVNLPPGAKFESFGTDIETNFDQFYKAIFNAICASVDIPPEVALQMYNSNYSASRAAINGWGYIIDIYRKKFTDDFYKPFYKLWLEVEVLKNKVEAPGFVKAIKGGDFMVTESYAQCRFIGKNMPHIDPLKEVKAIGEMLGLNLISREQGTELLNMGDWLENYQRKEEEDKLLPKIETDAAKNTITE